MLTNQSMDGVELICRTFLILRRIILKLRLSFWKKTTVQPRKFFKRLTKSSRTTATAVLRNFGTQNDEGEQICLLTVLTTSVDEAVFVASTIDNIVREKVKNFKDFAVLYRTNAQSRTIEEALLKSNIPYTMLVGQNSTAVKRFVMLFLI